MSRSERRDSTDVAAWMQAAGAGDEAAIAALWHRFEPIVAAYVRGRMGDRTRRWTDPEAIVQCALSEVLGAPDRLPPDADEDECLKRLFRTARSRIYDANRDHQRDVGESVAPGRSHAPPPESSSGAVTREDTQRWVRELVQRLPARYAEAIRLCALEELSFVDAGARLGISADTVRKRYEKARNLIEERVARRHA